MSSPPPNCAQDAGSWCARVFGWTHSDLLSRSADLIVDRALAILLIVVLALLARTLLHRAIRKLVRGAASGHVRLPAALRNRPGRGVAPSYSQRRAQRADTIGSVLRSITSVLVLTVAAIMVMAEFGLNLAPVLASAGIVGVAVGFGAQNLVKDFLSGMFMLLEDQYGVGDVVDVGAASGTVEDVGLRITTLRDAHGTVWHVRNGAIERVGNMSHGYAVAVVDLPLAHRADLAQATEIAGQVAVRTAERDDVAQVILEPPQVLGVQTVTVEGVTLRVIAKVRPGAQFAVQRALNAAITRAFDEAGLPWPTLAPPHPPEQSPNSTRSPL